MKGALLPLLLCAGCTLANRVDESAIPAGALPAEVCDDGVDNDFDGDIDCDDRNCRLSTHCEAAEETCCDGADNDGDGSTDCEHASCSFATCCSEGGTEDSCSDREDNDKDGLLDCMEEACRLFEYCQEGTDEACQDRIDNDDDGRVDCADPSCFDRLVCFANSPRRRDERCEGERGAFDLADGFDGANIDGTIWEVFHTNLTDAPRLADGGSLDPNGRDGFEAAGLASRERFGVGADQPFELEVVVRPEGPCVHPACALRIELHTRRTWGDLLSDGGTVLGWEIRGTDALDRVQLVCRYHDQAVTPTGEDERHFGRGHEWKLTLQSDPQAGRTRFLVDDDVLCTTPLLPAEPETRLVLHASGPIRERPDDTGGRVLVDRVSLDVRRQRVADRCRGLRTSVFDDGFCRPGGLDPLGKSRPVIVAPGGDFYGYHLYYLMHYAEGLRDIGHVVSHDPREGWTLEPEDAPILGRNWTDWGLGSVIYDPERRRFEAWLRVGGTPTHFATAEHAEASVPDATGFDAQDALSLSEGGAGPVLDATAWLPEAVVRVEEGYLGWSTHAAGDGRSAIWLSRSGDGVAWTLEPEPVLTGGGSDAWDGEGVAAPSVTHANGYLILAFESRAFGVPSAIGMAASPDGTTWLKHRDNPLVRGEEPGFDLDGVGQPAILWDAGILRVWYTAEHFEVLRCPDAASTGRQLRIGLAEVRFEEDP